MLEVVSRYYQVPMIYIREERQAVYDIRLITTYQYNFSRTLVANTVGHKSGKPTVDENSEHFV